MAAPQPSQKSAPSVLLSSAKRQPKNAVLFGQSSGGYASLAAAKYLPGCSAIAVAPQTFGDRALKSSLHFLGGLKPLIVPDVIDLYEHWCDGDPEGKYLAVLMSASEVSNSVTRYFWMDYAHMLHFAKMQTVHTYVLPSAEHPLVHGRSAAFADIIARFASRAGQSTQDRHSTILDELGVIFPSPA